MSLSVPELQQLHYNILDYLTKRSRIMSSRQLSAWNEFTAYYNYRYSDYSREDLRKEFFTIILPKVFTYNLTNIQRRKVEIFATHYHFEPTADGFRELRSTWTQQPVEGVDYVRSSVDTQFKVACVVTESESISKTPYPDKTISAWASAINSSDAEVASYCYYRGSGLRKRVRKARQQFKQTGLLPVNMNPSIVKKIIGFRNKAEKLSSMLRCGYV